MGIRPVHWRPVHLPMAFRFSPFRSPDRHPPRSTTAQRNIVNFGLFMTLLPHLIAGPVKARRDLAAAIEGRSASTSQFSSGIRRFLIGLAKKVLLANTLGMTADEMFLAAPLDLAASAAWLGAVCYALHIYFDFSGYSDMAIGLGRMFGFELCENFRYPYAADSITDFWRRWHISLSTWFRDYLYIPLGGNRGSQARTAVNLFAVFILCGLWHGRELDIPRLACSTACSFPQRFDRQGAGARPAAPSPRLCAAGGDHRVGVLSRRFLDSCGSLFERDGGHDERYETAQSLFHR